MVGSLDAQRIEAEIIGAGSGTDPFSAAVRATRMPMVITNPRLPDNPIVFCNDSFCRLTGYARAEILGRNCRFLQGPGSDPATIQRLRDALAARAPLQVDLRNYRKDGEPFWNRLLMAPVFDEAGALAYFFASQVDVTIERERLAALESDNASLTVEVADRLAAQRESETRLRIATESARIAVWEVELASRKLTATPTLNTVYGVAAGTVPSFADIRAVAHPDDAATVATAFDRAARGDGEYHVSYRVQRQDGEIGWVEARGQVVRADDGRPIRIFGVSTDITARKIAEEKLALSEESLRLATEAAGVGTWDLDLTTDTLTWSDRTKAMFGISPGVPCSMADFYAGLHSHDRDAVSAAFAAAIDPDLRREYDVEYRTVGKEDKLVRWVAAKGNALFANGRCMRALGTAIDITDRRRTAARQAFLLRLADDLRTLGDPRAVLRAAMKGLGPELNANRVGYSQVQDDDTTILLETAYLDAAASLDGTWRLDDFGPDLIERNRAGEVVVCPDTELDPAIAQETWRAIGTRSFMSVPLVREGRFRASLFVMRNEPSAWNPDDVRLVEDVAARTWDAVERARAEAELHDSEERLRAVIAAAPIGLIFASAPDGRITGGNAQAERILRHPILPSANVDEYGQWVGFHLDGRQIEGHEYPLARALAGEERPELEASYQRGDGTQAYLKFIGAPVRRAGGEIVGGVVASLDVDRERRAEAALKDLNATLERRVEERSAELLLAEQALRQAQKMEAVGQLTGGIAHDFNNMLAIVLGSLDLLKRRLPADDARALKYTEQAMVGARRAATLTQRLLAFSRRQPLQPVPVDVNRLVTGMSELLRGSLGGAVQLETVLAGGTWPVFADPNQLENVILNLGINARDAMPDGGRLTVETQNAHLDARYVATEAGVAPGQYVLIAVTDSGTGMPESVVAKAFDPFFTTKPVGKGTGLGLSQVHGFVHQSGGHVKIYSEVGVGTTVKLYLPRLVGAQPAEPADTAEQALNGDRELVLVVEDEDAVRAMSAEVLRELGYRVIEADGAAAALTQLDGHPEVALLFSDIVMPEVNGAKLAELARQRRPGLKVLFTTGYSRDAVVHNGVIGPGVDLIGKPFTVEDLSLKVRAVLDA